MSDLSFTPRLREYELAQVLPYFPPAAKVLEIGAGAGWQARLLQERGFSVTAVDLPQSNYAAARIFPIIDYDGRRLPFADRSFDLVFSSHVMEHVPQVLDFQAEVQRVLRPGGRAVYLLPSATGRLWTVLAHYPFLLQVLWGKIRSRAAAKSAAPAAPAPPRRRPRWRALFADTHGARGNFLSEIAYCAGGCWRRLFRRSGWKICASRGAGLFYTGYLLGSRRLGIPARRWLSRILGSSSLLFILEKRDGDG